MEAPKSPSLSFARAYPLFRIDVLAFVHPGSRRRSAANRSLLDLSRDFGDFVRWNKIANLAQDVQLASCWFDRVFLFHACRAAGLNRQANTFFSFSVGWLCFQFMGQSQSGIIPAIKVCITSEIVVNQLIGIFGPYGLRVAASQIRNWLAALAARRAI
jgi:hypothetical protein